MPIYEYECKRCGVFEVTQRITENPLSRCPTCHRKVKKLISQTSFQLKGTGWYVTDYGRKGNGSSGRDSAPKAATSGNGSKDSGSEKSESKKAESTKEGASA